MTLITSHQFYRAWLDTVKKREKDLLDIWQKPTKFTEYIKGSDNSVMSEIAEKLNMLSYEQDYYSLDSILYKKEDKTPKIPENSYWFRDLRVAFEHENNFKGGLYQEVSHLLIVNCDLKVLVTYPNGDMSDSATKKEMDYLHEVISGNRRAETISETESFLIIFGYENKFVWEAFLYHVNGWKELKL